jgi:prevent-host-death family protein
MKEITTAEARRNMSELLNRAAYGKERFVVTRHGNPLVAIVPLEEATLLDRLRALLARKDFEAALQEMEQSGTRAWDDVRRDLELGG